MVVCEIGADKAPHCEEHDWSRSVCDSCKNYPIKIRAEIVFGFGAVEHVARAWSGSESKFRIEEIEKRVWSVYGADGYFIGVIGEGPVSIEHLCCKAMEIADSFYS